MDILKYFESELRRLQVDLRLSRPVSDDLVREIAPDEVVLATGSLPDMPMVKGLYQTAMQLCTVSEILAGAVEPGQRVLVYGGGQAGLVLADELASRGRSVTVLHRKEHFAEEMSSNDRYYLRERLKGHGIKLYKNVRALSFVAAGVRFGSGEQTTELRGFDTVALADGFVSVREAVNTIKPHCGRIHLVGDAKGPRHVMYAIGEGEEIGRTL